jgi:hypothetical protein
MDANEVAATFENEEVNPFFPLNKIDNFDYSSLDSETIQRIFSTNGNLNWNRFNALSDQNYQIVGAELDWGNFKILNTSEEPTFRFHLLPKDFKKEKSLKIQEDVIDSVQPNKFSYEIYKNADYLQDFSKLDVSASEINDLPYHLFSKDILSELSRNKSIQANQAELSPENLAYLIKFLNYCSLCNITNDQWSKISDDDLYVKILEAKIFAMSPSQIDNISFHRLTEKGLTLVRKCSIIRNNLERLSLENFAYVIDGLPIYLLKRVLASQIINQKAKDMVALRFQELEESAKIARLEKAQRLQILSQMR